MIRRDYIMRIISQLIKALGKLSGLITAKQFKEAFDYGSQQSKELFGLDFRQLLDSAPEEIMSEEMRKAQGVLDSMGNYFTMMCEVSSNMGDYETAANMRVKALFFLETAESESKSFSLDRQVAINELKEKLF